MWKAPVEGRRIVRRLNIDSDEQGDLAGHRGEHCAVFVYQIASYRAIGRNISGEAISLTVNFGENFTADGLPDDTVCIGDRFRIGSAPV